MHDYRKWFNNINITIIIQTSWTEVSDQAGDSSLLNSLSDLTVVTHYTTYIFFLYL